MDSNVTLECGVYRCVAVVVSVRAGCGCGGVRAGCGCGGVRAGCGCGDEGRGVAVVVGGGVWLHLCQCLIVSWVSLRGLNKSECYPLTFTFPVTCLVEHRVVLVALIKRTILFINSPEVVAPSRSL